MPLFSQPLDHRPWLQSNNFIIYSSLAAATAALAYRSSRQSTSSTKTSAADLLNSTKRALFKETEEETFKQHKPLFPVVDVVKKVGVNDEFFRQLRAIAKILFPNYHTKEVFLLILHSIFLILRTYLSVVVARIDGRIVRDLVCFILPSIWYTFFKVVNSSYIDIIYRSVVVESVSLQG